MKKHFERPNRRTPALLAAVAVIALALVSLVACSDSPTEPETALQARFTGTFAPSVINELGEITRECSIELAAQPTGGNPGYAFEWQITWLRQAVLVEGYPAGEGVALILPPDFGGGLYAIRLVVVDSSEESASASTERRFDCAAGEGLTFSGF